MKLYELTEEFTTMYNDDDVDDLALEKVAKTIQKKAEDIVKLMKSWHSDSKAIAEEVKLLNAKKRASDNRIKSMKKYILENMEDLKMDVLPAGAFKLKTVTVNKATVDVEDAEVLPKEYQKQTITADKTKILEDYKVSKICPVGAIINDGYKYLKIS
ncbi:MAG: hypothetical protein GY804_00560 [Alphaproteobacteria bacterium]|nr:hypothetical protein [Alphaproteobacteria bacterium]